MTDNRATGWKVPLIFCAAIIIVCVFSAFLRRGGQMEAADVPQVPESLMAKAKEIVINLEATPEGLIWREKIYRASGGFATRQTKDDNMVQVAESAINSKAFDAACAAAVLIYDNRRRDAIFSDLAKAVYDDCERLPWAVFASKGFEDNAMRAVLNTDLAQMWDKCKQ